MEHIVPLSPLLKNGDFSREGTNARSKMNKEMGLLQKNLFL